MRLGAGIHSERKLPPLSDNGSETDADNLVLFVGLEPTTYGTVFAIRVYGLPFPRLRDP